MKILIKSADFNRNETAKSWATDYVEKCVMEFLNDNSIIDQIVLADDKNYGDEIHRIKALYDVPSGYTDNSSNTAIAKTIANSNNRSSVVFPDFIFGGIYGEFLKSQTLEQWDPAVQLFYYTIFHELSHCQDNVIRTSLHDGQNFKRSNFKVSILKEHFIGVLFSEFAACSLSRKKMSNSVFEQELRNTVESCNSYLPDL